MCEDCNQTEERKQDHINICLKNDVEFNKSNEFEEFTLDHRSVPEISLEEISMDNEFLGREIKYPLFINAMTGGADRAERINKNLAEAAQSLGIGMGVGSQRAMIEKPELTYTYQVRDVASDIFLMGNLGLPQLVRNYGPKEAKKAVESIDADALAVHLNPLQESIQPNGDTDFRKGLESIEELKDLEFPVIAKETGSGISQESARLLENAGIDAIDIAGAGGASWSAVEYYRATGENKRLAKKFWNWGIPTAYSLLECSDTESPLIASGGIRSGIEVAKSIAMGAEAVGIALPLLEPAMKGSKEVEDKLEQIISELRTTMFLVGAESIEELKKVPVTVEE